MQLTTFLYLPDVPYTHVIRSTESGPRAHSQGREYYWTLYINIIYSKPTLCTCSRFVDG